MYLANTTVWAGGAENTPTHTRYEINYVEQYLRHVVDTQRPNEHFERSEHPPKSIRYSTFLVR